MLRGRRTTDTVTHSTSGRTTSSTFAITTAVAELWPAYRKKNKANAVHEERATLRRFLQELVEGAFRGPISDETRRLYIDQQLDKAEDNAEAIKRVLLMCLKSS